MSTNSGKSNDEELLHQMHVTREILLKPFEKSHVKEGRKKHCNNKVFYLNVPMEAHIIALIKGLS